MHLAAASIGFANQFDDAVQPDILDQTGALQPRRFEREKIPGQNMERILIEFFFVVAHLGKRHFNLSGGGVRHLTSSKQSAGPDPLGHPYRRTMKRKALTPVKLLSAAKNYFVSMLYLLVIVHQ